MKTLHANRWFSLLWYPLMTPSLGVSLNINGRLYRYLWTLTFGLWKGELTVRWWSRGGARFKRVDP